MLCHKQYTLTSAEKWFIESAGQAFTDFYLECSPEEKENREEVFETFTHDLAHDVSLVQYWWTDTTLDQRLTAKL